MSGLVFPFRRFISFACYCLLSSIAAEAFQRGRHGHHFGTNMITPNRVNSLYLPNPSSGRIGSLSSSKNKIVGGRCRSPKATLHALSPEMSFIPSLTAPDPLVAAVVNGIGFLLLKVSNQKSLTPAGLVNSAILGLGLWTFLGAK